MNISLSEITKRLEVTSKRDQTYIAIFMINGYSRKYSKNGTETAH